MNLLSSLLLRFDRKHVRIHLLYLLVVPVLASMLGCSDTGIHPSERRAVSRLRSVGARKIKTDDEKRVVSIAVEGPRVTQIALKELSKLPRLEELDLSAAPFPDQDLSFLAELQHLRFIDLTGFASDAPVTDRAILYLEKLPNLEVVLLGYTKIGDESLRSLSKVKTLRGIYAANTEVTDAGLCHLRNLENLESLDVSGTEVTPEALAEARSFFRKPSQLTKPQEDTMPAEGSGSLSHDHGNAVIKVAESNKH